MDPLLSKIAGHPSYKLLLERRKKLAIPLSILMLVSYYGFILAIAFNPGFLSQRTGDGVTTLGIWLGFGLIILTFAITGFFVAKTNKNVEPLVEEIQRAVKGE